MATSVIKNIGGQLMANGAGAHNSQYRGKYLGSSVTAAQWAAIQDGTFRDMYIGDYWEIGGVKWRIADFDYWFYSGDTECTTHHVVIVPDTVLYNAQMNSSSTTAKGYVSSTMRSSGLNSAKTTINSAFGSAHILNHRELLVDATSSGIPSHFTWVDSTVELMSEAMAFGLRAWDSAGRNAYGIGNSKNQLALFRYDHSRLRAINSAGTKMAWWLRSISSDTDFSACATGNIAGFNGASASLGVRPVFGICA